MMMMLISITLQLFPFLQYFRFEFTLFTNQPLTRFLFNPSLLIYQSYLRPQIIILSSHTNSNQYIHFQMILTLQMKGVGLQASIHNKISYILLLHLSTHGHAQIIYYVHTYVCRSGTGRKMANLKVGEMYRYACVFRCEDRFLQHSWSPKNKRSKYPYPCIIIRTETQLRWK